MLISEVVINKLNRNKLRTWKDVIEFIKNNDSFFIFGTGVAGRTTKNYLESMNKKVVGYIDNNLSRIGKFIDGIMVFPPSVLRKSKFPIIVSSGWFIEIAHQLIEEFNFECCKDFVPFYAYDWFMFNIHIGSEFFELLISSYDKISHIMKQIKDEYSKELLLKILRYRSLFLNPENLNLEELPYYYEHKFYNEKSLLDKSVTLLKSKGSYKHYALSRNYKIIIEAGAYIGDTAILFSELYPEAKIFSFEPCPENFKILVRNVAEYKNVVPINLGLWRHTKKASINFNFVNPRTTTIDISSDKGNIDLISIDELVKERKLKPDLIKLDIEGAELEALEGAKETLEKYYPDLIVAIYHKGKDLWEIPSFIINNFPHYKIYIHHSDVFIGSTKLIAVRR